MATNRMNAITTTKATAFPITNAGSSTSNTSVSFLANVGNITISPASANDITLTTSRVVCNNGIGSNNGTTVYSNSSSQTLGAASVTVIQFPTSIINVGLLTSGLTISGTGNTTFKNTSGRSQTWLMTFSAKTSVSNHTAIITVYDASAVAVDTYTMGRLTATGAYHALSVCRIIHNNYSIQCSIYTNGASGIVVSNAAERARLGISCLEVW